MPNDSTIGNIYNWIDANCKHKLLFPFERSYRYFGIANHFLATCSPFISVSIRLFFPLCLLNTTTERGTSSEWSIRIIPIYSWRKKIYALLVFVCYLFGISLRLSFAYFRFICFGWRVFDAERSSGRSGVHTTVCVCLPSRKGNFEWTAYRKWENGIIRKRAWLGSPEYNIGDLGNSANLCKNTPNK